MPDPPAASAHRRPQNLSYYFTGHWPLLPGAPACVPPIRVIRLESLPRARRGGPPHPVRKLIQFAIAYTRPRRDSLWHPPLPPCEQKNAFHHNDTKTRRVFNYLTTSLRSFASFAVGNLFPALPASRFHPDVPGHVLFSNRCSVTPSPHLGFLLVN